MQKEKGNKELSLERRKQASVQPGEGEKRQRISILLKYE